MVKNRNFVTINVDKGFFENLFEPARKKTQKKLQLQNLTQTQFSAMIFKSGMKMDIKLKDFGGINGLQTFRKRKKR